MSIFASLLIGIVTVIVCTFLLGILLRLLRVFPADESNRKTDAPARARERPVDSTVHEFISGYWTTIWQEALERGRTDGDKKIRGTIEALRYLDSIMQGGGNQSLSSVTLKVLRHKLGQTGLPQEQAPFLVEIKQLGKTPALPGSPAADIWTTGVSQDKRARTAEGAYDENEEGIATASKRWYLPPELASKSIQ